MFLIRAVFCLSIVILLVPANPETNTPAPRVSMIEAAVATRAAVSDFANFCERNPDVCVTGAAAFDIFSEKAQNGARLLLHYFNDLRGENATPPDQGTLTDSDRLLEWRGPSEDGAA
jgi:hypothetical protein